MKPLANQGRVCMSQRRPNCAAAGGERRLSLNHTVYKRAFTPQQRSLQPHVVIYSIQIHASHVEKKDKGCVQNHPLIH